MWFHSDSTQFRILDYNSKNSNGLYHIYLYTIYIIHKCILFGYYLCLRVGYHREKLVKIVF